MKTILILTAILLVTISVGQSQFIAHVSNVERVPDAIAPVTIPANVGQSDEAGPEIKLVLLALLPSGFETNEMQLDAGEYLFIIGNRTGLKEVSMQINRENQGRLGQATVGGRQRDWKQRFKLTPGNYIVNVDEHPEWNCRIEVKP